MQQPSLLANMETTWPGFVTIKPGLGLESNKKCNKDDGLFRINSRAYGCFGGGNLHTPNQVARTYEGIKWLY